MGAEYDIEGRKEVALRAAFAAGEFVRSAREEGALQIRFKGERDLVTQADIAAEKIILERIRAAFPEDSILSEEANPTLLRQEDFLKPLWVIDPIDGTTNFAQGHPQVGVSIAFAVEGKVELGVVHAPFLSETFSAVRGKGAYLNEKRLQIVDESVFSRSLIGTGFPYARDDIGDLVKRLHRVLKGCRDLRRLGAASLDISWVACGRLQGFYETLSPWDMAAACLVAREAGARVGHIYGLPTGVHIPEELYAENLVVACPGIYEEFLSLLKL